jgi:hypothetical protein
MDMHFLFLLNNYKQVGQILTEMPTAIAAFKSGKTLDECDYAEHLKAEHVYLASHKKALKADVIASRYISLLIVYTTAW